MSLNACPTLPRKPHDVNNKIFHALLVYMWHHQPQDSTQFWVWVGGMILPSMEESQGNWYWEQYSLRDDHHLLEVFLLLLSAYWLTPQPVGKYCIHFELLPTSCSLVYSLNCAAACQWACIGVVAAFNKSQWASVTELTYTSQKLCF